MKLVGLLDKDNEIKYQLDFYGQVVPEFKDRFDDFVYKSEKVNYHGV